MNHANHTNRPLTRIFMCAALTTLSGISVCMIGCASTPPRGTTTTTGALSDIEQRRAEAWNILGIL